MIPQEHDDYSKPLMDERKRSIRQKLKSNFEHFCLKCMKIRPKDGQIEPLILNRAQKYLHERLQLQLQKHGKVRALVLKGRQQGVSTYIGARYYHRAIHSFGQRVFILTHEQDATDNLFEMVNRYHEHCPSTVKPHTGAANAKELDFDILDSSYRVGTAGAKAVGRSQTLQLFHASEYAFWPNADLHAAGVLQAVPELPGTEIIKESTANGMGNPFHQEWQKAESGLSEYEAIFIPWFWQDEYRREVPEEFFLDEDDLLYQAAHGLDNEQMSWRQNKISTLGELLFKQEYPATASEAFQLTGHDSYITPASVLKARKNSCEAIGPLIIGADPSWGGEDRFSLAWRRGRVVQKIESKLKIMPVDAAYWIKQIIDEDEPDAVFVDVGGAGVATVDMLHNFGEKYKQIVKAVNFGGSPTEKPRPPVAGSKGDAKQKGGPANRRAEMWKRSKEWLEDVGEAQIPDLDSLQSDACAPGFKYNMYGQLLIEAKQDMKKRGMRSPDEWDAIALTFADTVGERKKPLEIGKKKVVNLVTPQQGGRWMK
jgi:hypothetical protein